MAVWSWLLLVMAVVGIQAQSNRTITQTDIDTIISLHNSLRSGIAPIATDMHRVVWDAELAVSAQKYADTCPTAHSGTANLGENLSWGWPTMTAADAVQEWVKEGPNYAYASNTCASGKVCAHYTQMIWFNSAKIGCGIRSCPNILGQAVADAWVCHYTIAGNIVGSKPYTTGAASCSACPNTTVCMENLCTVPGTTATPAAAAASPIAGATPAASSTTTATASSTPTTLSATPESAAGTPAALLARPAGMPTPLSPATSAAGAIPLGTLASPAIPAALSATPASASQLSPAIASATPGTALRSAAVQSGVKANLPSSRTPIPIGIINDNSSSLATPLSPFTIVQAKNKTVINISEYSIMDSNTTLPNITQTGNGTITIMGFPHRTFFG